MLRLAFGSASCSQDFKDPRFLEIAKIILERIEAYKQADSLFLRSFPSEYTEYLEIGGKKASLTVFNERMDDKRNLIVVQAFIPTFKGLNYISLAGSGRVFAEGIWVGDGGLISGASEEDLYQFS